MTILADLSVTQAADVSRGRLVTPADSCPCCLPPWSFVSSRGNLCTTRYFDAAGVELWNANHGATVRDVAIDDAGNVYEVGDESGTITLRKRDATGALLWTASHGATLNRCVITSDGGVVAGGAAGSGGSTLRKWSSSGTLEWSNTTAGPIVSLAVDSSGSIAALENLAVNEWDSLIYAFAADGTPGLTQHLGTAGPGLQFLTPTAVAFWGVNGSGYAGTFTQRIAVAQYNVSPIDSGSWRWLAQEGFSTPTGTITLTNSLLPGRARHLVGRVGSPGVQIGAVATNTGGWGYHPVGTAGGAVNHDPIGSGSMSAVAAHSSRDVYIGSTIFYKYPFIPPLSAAPYWGSPSWSHDHHALILGCAVNNGSVSVMGGAVATI